MYIYIDSYIQTYTYAYVHVQACTCKHMYMQIPNVYACTCVGMCYAQGVPTWGTLHATDGPREDLVERERERDLFPFPFPFSCYRSITVLCPFLCPFPGTDYLYLRGHFYIKNLLFQFKNLVNVKHMH